MRKLLGLLRLADVVYTKDHDGAVRLRLVHIDPWGVRTVYGLGWFRRGQLMRDGTVVDGSYVVAWKPYRIGDAMSTWLAAPQTEEKKA